ncbi:hypothetical protein HY450_02935 [Candidatus Pacearchaeota archaeon]|nr:hypothetical protein [Candidatus Pacearchaeota archaeon]
MNARVNRKSEEEGSAELEVINHLIREYATELRILEMERLSAIGYLTDIVHQFNLSVFHWWTIREPTPRNLVGSLYIGGKE